MLVAPGKVEQNFQRLAEKIRIASEAGSQVVLLPEALPFGWMDRSAVKDATEIPDGKHCRFLRKLAEDSRVYLCAGLIERAGERLFNAAVLIGPEGEVLIHHRKINELDIARGLYSLGDRLAVAETKFGRMGLMICADAFAEGQVISRTLGLMGAKVILSPCAWAVPPDHDNERTPYGGLWMDNYGPVAREFKLWIAGCSNVGPVECGAWAGHKCIGCSLIVGPSGEKHLMGSYGVEADEIICSEILLEG